MTSSSRKNAEYQQGSRGHQGSSGQGSRDAPQIPHSSSPHQGQTLESTVVQISRYCSTEKGLGTVVQRRVRQYEDSTFQWHVKRPNERCMCGEREREREGERESESESEGEGESE